MHHVPSIIVTEPITTGDVMRTDGDSRMLGMWSWWI